VTGKAVEADSARQGTVWTPEHAAEHVRAAYGREVGAVLATGQALAEAKDRLPHGQWAAAVALLPFADRTARRYMRVAANSVLAANRPKWAVLPSSVHALDQLAQLADARLAAALEDGTVTAEMTLEDAKALVRTAGSLTPGRGKPQIQSKPDRGKPEKPEPGKPPGDATNAQNGPEDSSPGTEKNTAAPAASPSSPVQDSVQTGTTEPAAAPAAPAAKPDPEPEPQPDPQPCPRCAPQVAHLEQLADDLGAELEKAHAEAERLGRIRPDVVMAAELAAVAEDRDALAARVAELEARLSAPPDGSELEDPDADPQTGPEAADWADGALPAPSGRRGRRQVCGNPRASKVRLVVEGRPVRVTMPGGREAGELWLCGEHIEQVTAGGAEADPVDAGPDEDSFGFGEVSPCEYPAPAGVPA
jgi:hypothetical protein